MQLAHQGLVDTRDYKRTQKYDWKHAENLQERCFYRRKSPCGMQRARQELVKLNSVKIQAKIMEFQANLNQLVINQGLGD